MAPAVVLAPYAHAVDSPDINNNLCGGAAKQKLESGVNCTDIGQGTVDTLNDKIAKIINILSVLVGIVAVIMIIIGGFRYITSAGSSEKVTAAKNTILYGIIGLIIVALAQVIVKFVLAKAGP